MLYKILGLILIIPAIIYLLSFLELFIQSDSKVIDFIWNNNFIVKYPFLFQVVLNVLFNLGLFLLFK